MTSKSQCPNEQHVVRALPRVYTVGRQILLVMAGMEEKRNVYRLLVGKPEGKTPLGRSRRRWIDNIKMDLLRDRIECCGPDWFGAG
jgi:hypothetical protein